VPGTWIVVVTDRVALTAESKSDSGLAPLAVSAEAGLGSLKYDFPATPGRIFCPQENPPVSATKRRLTLRYHRARRLLVSGNIPPYGLPASSKVDNRTIEADIAFSSSNVQGSEKRTVSRMRNNVASPVPKSVSFFWELLIKNQVKRRGAADRNGTVEKFFRRNSQKD